MDSCKRVPKIVINIVKENAAKSTVISPLRISSSHRHAESRLTPKQKEGWSTKVGPGTSRESSGESSGDSIAHATLQSVTIPVAGKHQDMKGVNITHSPSERSSTTAATTGPPHIKREPEDEDPPAQETDAHAVRMGIDSAFANLQKSFSEQVDQFRHSTQEKIGMLETSDRQLRDEINFLKNLLKQGDRKKLELKEQIEFMEREAAVERAAKISLHESLHQERIEKAEERRQFNDHAVKMQEEMASLKKTIEQQQILFDTEMNERHRERNGYHEMIKRKTEENERDKSAYVAAITTLRDEKRKLKEECDAAVAKNVSLTAQLEKEKQRSRLNNSCDAEFGKFMATAMMRGARGDFLDGFNRGVLENQHFALAPDPLIPVLKLPSTAGIQASSSSSGCYNGTPETRKRSGAEVEDPTGTKWGRNESDT